MKRTITFARRKQEAPNDLFQVHRSAVGFGGPLSREAIAHCLGFTLGAVVVGIVGWMMIPPFAPPFDPESAGTGELIRRLWPIYIGAPAAHLACLWIARARFGWPGGTIRAPRLMKICLALYVAIGVARVIAYKDPWVLLTWPARDLAGFHIPATR